MPQKYPPQKPLSRTERVKKQLGIGQQRPSSWQIAESTRRTLLILLGLIALAMGVMIALTQPRGPSFILFQQFAGWPTWWGVTLGLAGLFQRIGLALQRNWMSFVGCTVAAMWYFVFGLGFAIQYLMWVADRYSEIPPSAYPVVLYIGLACMHGSLSWGIFQHWMSERSREKKRKENHDV